MNHYRRIEYYLTKARKPHRGRPIGNSGYRYWKLKDDIAFGYDIDKPMLILSPTDEVRFVPVHGKFYWSTARSFKNALGIMKLPVDLSIGLRSATQRGRYEGITFQHEGQGWILNQNLRIQLDPQHPSRLQVTHGDFANRKLGAADYTVNQAERRQYLKGIKVVSAILKLIDAAGAFKKTTDVPYSAERQMSAVANAIMTQTVTDDLLSELSAMVGWSRSADALFHYFIKRNNLQLRVRLGVLS